MRSCSDWSIYIQFDWMKDVLLLISVMTNPPLFESRHQGINNALPDQAPSMTAQYPE
jgi:hypothetical protein